MPRIIPSFPNLNQIGVEYFKITVDDTPTEIFSTLTVLNSTGKFEAKIQCIDSTASIKGGWVREVIVKNFGNSLQMGFEHSPFTDKDDMNLNVYWEPSASEMRLMVQGLPATTFKWSGLIAYNFTEI